MGMENDLEIVFKSSQVSRSKIIYHWDEDGRLKGEMISKLPITYRRDNINGVFNHEIGTHFLRKYNDI